MKKTIHTKSEKETREVASHLANYLEPQMTILLEGQLGAGKTTFTKGLAEGLGIARVVKSPTYTLIREYLEGSLPLYHMDLYRLEETGAEELGLDEYFEGEGVCVVEWGSMAPDELPKEHLTVELTVPLDKMEERKMVFSATGQRYEKVLVNIDE